MYDASSGLFECSVNLFHSSASQANPGETPIIHYYRKICSFSIKCHFFIVLKLYTIYHLKNVDPVSKFWLTGDVVPTVIDHLIYSVIQSLIG